MKLDLTPEQAFFHRTTRQFLDDKVPTSLLVSEADGGGSVSGQGLVDLALVAFEFGRYAAPGPLTAANVVTATVARSGVAGSGGLGPRTVRQKRSLRRDPWQT